MKHPIMLLCYYNANAANNANNNAIGEKNWLLKTMHHLLIGSQKLMV